MRGAVPVEKIASALASFKNVRRRAEYAAKRGIIVDR